MHSQAFTRVIVFIAALLGAAGVAAAAGATHTGDQALLGPLALIALIHAAALLALAAYAPPLRLKHCAALTLAAGAALFSADLAVRHFTAHALFPGAAPIGGTVLIVGWLILAVGALIGPRRVT
jgi:uncharacterized membrane protein YgdD (TMEM256/DUF423 family)